MVVLRLKENTSTRAVYEFLPNGKDVYIGVIAINKETKELELIKTEPYDFSYRMHACHRLRGYIEQNIYPQSDSVAWG